MRKIKKYDIFFSTDRVDGGADCMNEKFYNLTNEKQDCMINGAMEVFAINGFKRASTDEMVRVSGVSKGLWFHYFDNKLGL